MQQPKPSSTTFQTLLTDILKGAIKIPQFQREFVWERARSAKLLDSILKGYPLGTFILWKTKERLRAVRNIGNISLPPPPEDDYVFQVLDGQQRITSLFAALEGVTLSSNNDFSTICVDLDVNPDGDDQIVFDTPQNPGVPEGHVTIAFKTLRTQSILAMLDAGYTKDQLHRLEEYKRRLETYQFPTVEITGAPIAVATEIFTRLNVGGKSLSVFEIMVAKTWDDKQKFDLSEKVESLNKELTSVGFGNIDPTVMMQTVAALAVESIKSHDILAMKKQVFIDTWPLAVTALHASIDFCRSHLGIPVRELLPYVSLLIPLAYYFHVEKIDPAGEPKRRIVDLFFRIGISERYSSALETKVAQDLKAVRKIIKGEQPEYDFGVDVSADYILRNGYFRTGKAFIKTLLCLLSAEKPRCFKTGGHVILDNALLARQNSKNYHHFFPKAFLAKKPEFTLPANHIGNITLVGAHLNKNEIRAKQPSVYITAFSEKNTAINACLATHLIELTTMGVMEDNYDAFLTQRCKKLSEKLRGIITPQPKDALPQPDLSQSEPEETEDEPGIEADDEETLIGQEAGFTPLSNRS
jgi:hypothetical protein